MIFLRIKEKRGLAETRFAGAKAALQIPLLIRYRRKVQLSRPRGETDIILVGTRTRDVEAFLKKSAIAYRPNTRILATEHTSLFY